ncbi:hypothetical protein MKX08_000181 [Trichoderma sp. CBMAI-0020]|nr:hypothetical protein MKX08_000181 [Trichoderma sp. CBMAI-0020]
MSMVFKTPTINAMDAWTADPWKDTNTAVKPQNTLRNYYIVKCMGYYHLRNKEERLTTFLKYIYKGYIYELCGSWNLDHNCEGCCICGSYSPKHDCMYVLGEQAERQEE